MKKNRDVIHDATVEQLAHAASKRDLGALSELYELHAQRLYLHVLGQARNDAALAEEVTGETWVRVAKSIETYSPKGGGFPAWLFRIARNVLTDHWRAAATRRERVASDLLERAPFPDPTHGPEARAIAAQARVAIAKALDALLPDQRRVMVLHHRDRLSLAETAAAMGKTPASVAALHQRALKKLNPLLEAYSPRNFDVSTLGSITDGSERATEPAW